VLVCELAQASDLGLVDRGRSAGDMHEDVHTPDAVAQIAADTIGERITTRWESASTNPPLGTERIPTG
jgi:hypothetical protein